MNSINDHSKNGRPRKAKSATPPWQIALIANLKADFEPDEEDNDLRIQFDPEYEVIESFRKAECQFWREYAER